MESREGKRDPPKYIHKMLARAQERQASPPTTTSDREGKKGDKSEEQVFMTESYKRRLQGRQQAGTKK